MTKQQQQPNSIKMPGANAIAASALQNGKIVKQQVTTTLQTEDRPPEASKVKERYWILRDDIHRTFLNEIFTKIDPPTLERIYGGGSFIICPIDEHGNEIRDKEQRINIGGIEMSNQRYGNPYGQGNMNMNIPQIPQIAQIAQQQPNNQQPTTVIMPNNPPSPPPPGGVGDFLQMVAANKAIEDERRRSDADERKAEELRKKNEREEEMKRERAADEKKRNDELARADKQKEEDAAREKKKAEEKEAREQKIEDEERAHKRKMEEAKAALEEKLALAKLDQERKDKEKKDEQDRKDFEWKRDQEVKAAAAKAEQDRKDAEWKRDLELKELNEKKERAKQEELRADREKKEREERLDREEKARDREAKDRKEYREEQIRRDTEARKDAIALAQNKIETMKVMATIATSLIPKVLDSLKQDPPMIQPPPFVPTQDNNTPLLMSALERINDNVNSRNRRNRDEDEDDEDDDRRGGGGSGGGMEEAMSVLRMGIDLGRGNAPVAAEKKDEGLIDKLISAAPMLAQAFGAARGLTGQQQQQQVQQRPQPAQQVQQRKPVQRIEHAPAQGNQQNNQQTQQNNQQQNNQQQQAPVFTKAEVETVFEETLDQVFSDKDILKNQILKNPQKYGPAIMQLIQEDGAALMSAMNSVANTQPEAPEADNNEESGLDAFNAQETAEG